MILKKIDTKLKIIKEENDKEWNFTYRSLIPPIFEIKNSNKMHVFVDIKELENYLVDICNFYEKTKKLQIKNLIKIDNELKNIFEKFLIKLKNQKKFFQEIINQKIKIKKINLNYFKKNFIPYEFQLDMLEIFLLLVLVKQLLQLWLQFHYFIKMKLILYLLLVQNLLQLLDILRVN